MSYNTRRTGAGTGRGQTTQVNYHQQSRPGSVSGNATQQPRNPGYTTTQAANYNSAAQPAYSTQQPGYTTAPPLPTKAPSPPPQQAPTPVQPPPPPSQPSTPANNVKEEPLTPANTPMDSTPTTENGDVAQNKPFWRKKFEKLPAKVRRARQNAKIRNVLKPKNAITFLNEIRPNGVKCTVLEDINWGYIATLTVDGKTFKGHGASMPKSRLRAAEQALRYVLMDQMAKSQAKIAEQSKRQAEEMETDTKEEEGEGEEGKPKRKRPRIEEDDMPWGSLAAFALHKLFEEWQKDDLSPPSPNQNQYDDDVGEEAYSRRPGPDEYDYPRRFPSGPEGFGRGRGGPFPSRGAGPRRFPPPTAANRFQRPLFPLGNDTSTNKSSPMKKLPADANKRHPVMLLHHLKPDLVYYESMEGSPPDAVFIATLEFNGKEYVGRGKRKKEAKKMAAIAALAPLGVVYEGGEN